MLDFCYLLPRLIIHISSRIIIEKQEILDRNQQQTITETDTCSRLVMTQVVSIDAQKTFPQLKFKL